MNNDYYNKERLKKFEMIYNNLSKEEIEKMKDNILFLSFYYAIKNYECFYKKKINK
jgi:hypothetical protein